MAYLWTLLVMAIIPATLAYPSGAPAGACTAMVPGHRENGTLISPQAVVSPYTITTNTMTYSPSGTVTVSITGVDFQGILLQARRADNTIVGTFANPPAETKLMQCTSADDSVTHSSRTAKTAGTSFTWNAPTSDVGNITFTATVLQDYDIFWVMLRSQPVAVSGANWVCVNSAALFGLLLASVIFSRE